MSLLLINTFLFLVGFVLLIKGADLLVDGASGMAKKLGVSSLAIGLTVVAFGTSAPELIVNLVASFQGNTDLAVGNILGSNIANILLILGIAALIYPIMVKQSTIWKELPFSLLAVIILFIAANDILFDKASVSILSRSDGLLMVCVFIIFCVYTFGLGKSKILDPDPTLDHEHIEARPLWNASLMVIFGLVGLVVGGKWIVDGAVFFADLFGMSEALIGLTVVAVGTSLPELAAAIVAAYKKEPDIVIGNVIGSNIFNILWVLAISSIIRPLPFSTDLNHDITVVVLVTFLLFIFLVRGKENRLTRWGGIIFLILYAGYVGYLVIRG